MKFISLIAFAGLAVAYWEANPTAYYNEYSGYGASSGGGCAFDGSYKENYENAGRVYGSFNSKAYDCYDNYYLSNWDKGYQAIQDYSNVVYVSLSSFKRDEEQYGKCGKTQYKIKKISPRLHCHKREPGAYTSVNEYVKKNGRENAVQIDEQLLSRFKNPKLNADEQNKLMEPTERTKSYLENNGLLSGWDRFRSTGTIDDLTRPSVCAVAQLNGCDLNNNVPLDRDVCGAKSDGSPKNPEIESCLNFQYVALVRDDPCPTCPICPSCSSCCPSCPSCPSCSSCCPSCPCCSSYCYTKLTYSFGRNETDTEAIEAN